ncbi:hypothetical protein V6Z11_D05G244600 [Gossypium hirsutum]
MDSLPSTLLSPSSALTSTFTSALTNSFSGSLTSTEHLVKYNWS